MSRLVVLCSTAALLIFAARGSNVHAEHLGRSLAVIMTNDPVVNQIKVYDASTEALLQTLSTHGKGGVGGNARGVKQYNGELFAVVNRIVVDADGSARLHHRGRWRKRKEAVKEPCV